jgi:hypothetical protein
LFPAGRAAIKIFAPRIDINKISALRGAEIRCIKVRYPPFSSVPSCAPSVRFALLAVNEVIFRGEGRRNEPEAY